MIINEDFSVQNNLVEEIHKQLEQCKNITKKNFYVIGVGGKESWLTLLSAYEMFGYHNVLAVNINSMFSNSILPFKINALCHENNIQFCSVDITKTITELLSSSIDLFRMEKEKLGYMMSNMQKAEMIAMIRNSVLRGIADRHDGILLSGISLSKIISKWVSPALSMFDWNPLVNCSYSQVKLAIKNYNKGGETLLDLPSGLDLDARGGPFPKDFNINLENDDDIVKNAKETNIKNIGKGIYQ